MNEETEESIEDIEQRQIKEIGDADSKLLAANVVAYKVLGMKKDLAVACMAELSKRRLGGESFDYEDYIESEVAKIPKPQNIDIVSVTKNIQDQIRGMNYGTRSSKTNRS